MKRYLVFTLLMLCSLISLTQTADVRIKGRVYLTYITTSKEIQMSRNNYLSDFKVMLVRINGKDTDIKSVETNKQKFCSNDQKIFSTYPANVVYTNNEGIYEFKNLQPSSYYMLIFCDKKIQVSLISTEAKKKITYEVKDKKLVL